MFIHLRPKGAALERQLSERTSALEESERRFRDFAEMAADWLWETDAAHRFTFIAGAGSDAAGIRSEDIIGRRRWELAGADPESDETWRRHKGDLDARRPFRGFRYSFVTALGRRMHFSVSGKPTFDAEGTFLGYRGAVRNETEAVEALARVAEADAFLSDAIENMTDGFVIYDREDRFVMCNAAHRRFYPELAEVMVPGASFEEVHRRGLQLGIYAAAGGREDEWLAERLEQHRNPKGPIEQRLKSGAVIVISERRMSDGGILGVRMDVSALKKAEEARREEEERLLSIADNLPGAIFRRLLKTDGTFSYLYISPRMHELYGIDQDALVRGDGDPLRHLHPDDREMYRAALARSASELTPMVVELRLLTPDGQTRWLRSSSRPRKLENGDIQWDGITLDITDLKAAEAHRDRLAYYDQLTGLPNQDLFADRLAQALTQAARSRDSVAVLCIELASLKDVRASQGMAAGDQAVREAGRRIQTALRSGDSVAYAGGGQFLTLLMGLRKREDGRIPVAKIIGAFEEKYEIGGVEVPLKVSLGISLGPGDGDAAEALIRNATTALNMARTNPSQPYQFYDVRMTKTAVARLSVEAELRHAVERQEFVIFYQPVVEARSFRIVGAEALVRWRQADGTLAPVGEFMSIAEESGLAVPIGELVLAAACGQARAWRDADAANIGLSVSLNVSGAQLVDPGFAASVLGILERTGLPPSGLKLELAESTFARKAASAARAMEQLAEAGVQFAVDDFGVEYSVLSHLAHLPIDTLKIAQPFIARMTTDRAHGALVQAVISMAHAIGKNTVAEGVETQEQLTYLQAFQCNALQGSLFSEPVPAENLLPLLRQGALRPPPTKHQSAGS